MLFQRLRKPSKNKRKSVSSCIPYSSKLWPKVYQPTTFCLCEQSLEVLKQPPPEAFLGNMF